MSISGVGNYFAPFPSTIGSLSGSQNVTPPNRHTPEGEPRPGRTLLAEATAPGGPDPGSCKILLGRVLKEAYDLLQELPLFSVMDAVPPPAFLNQTRLGNLPRNYSATDLRQNLLDIESAIQELLWASGCKDEDGRGGPPVEMYDAIVDRIKQLTHAAGKIEGELRKRGPEEFVTGVFAKGQEALEQISKFLDSLPPIPIRLPLPQWSY